MKRLLAALAFACALAYVGSAGELTVAQDGTGDYTVIQDAIDNAQAGDTIWVKPGVYATGGRLNENYDGGVRDFSRVLVTKQLNIIATSDNPADTHIVGAPDPESRYGDQTYGGRGTNAVRCVRFELAASNNTNEKPSILKGFTIRDGYCRQYANNIEGSDACAGHPGGVTARSTNYENFYVVDCVVSNCYGVRGGMVRFGRYVRCRFKDGHGSAGNNIGRDCRMMSCLLDNPPASGLLGVTAVNSTFADGSTPFSRISSSRLLNVLMANCAKYDADSGNDGSAANCVLDYQPCKTFENCEIGLPYQLFAPLRGDFRVRSGTAAATRGDAAHIASVFPDAVDNEIIDIYRGRDGERFAKTGAIPVGCFAKPVVAVGGAIQYNDAVLVDGYAGVNKNLHAFSEKPYELVQVNPPAGKTFFRVDRTEGWGVNRYPEMDESLWEAFPPAGTFVTNVVNWVDAYMYVDADKGNDDTGDGTKGLPYQTLAACCTAAIQGYNTLVYAAEGDYNKGEISGAGMANRIAYPGRRIRFKGAGRGKSFISGKAATESPSGDGRGTDAVRCAYLGSGWACIQGFTLREGYSLSGTDSSNGYLGGLALMSTDRSPNNAISDCELIGGCAFRGGIAYGGTLNRCIIRGCAGLGGGAMRGTVLNSCLSYGHDFPSGSASINGNDCQAFQSTLVADGYAHGASMVLRNSISVSGGSTGLSGMGNVSNTVYKLGGSFAGGTEGVSYVKADPLFADAANGDYRVLTISPAVTKRFPVQDDYWKRPLTDVNGVPIRIADGTVVCGAIQTPVMAVVADAPKYGSFTSGAGTNVLEKGESVTVTYADGSRRHAEAMLVNGEEVPGMSYTYTAGDPFAADGTVVPAQVVTLRYSTNWYVNAEMGDDSATGFTPETAWKSLTNIYTTGYVLAGDCVHAAAGDYAEGDVTVASVGRCRVSLPENVSLVADEGPAVTRIVGAGDDGSTETYKRGANAIRCAYVRTKSRIVGFTLADGRVSDTGTGESSAACGGGICASTRFSNDANCGALFGCVVTNCVGARGGAAYQGRMVNCSVIDCVAPTSSPAGYYTAFFGCYFDNVKRGAAESLLRNCSVISHCTVGPNVSPGRIIGAMTTPYVVENNVFLSEIKNSDGSLGRTYKNCVLVMSEANWANVSDANKVGCVRIDSAADAGLGPDCRPLRTSSLVLDKAAATAYESQFLATDLDGVQRTYNGARDIGAFEYDWRADYAADLGGLAQVVKADPQVVEADGLVLVKDGAIALAFAPCSGHTAKYDIPLEVSGTGTLTVKAGDVAIATYTAADGQQTLRIRDRDTGSDYVLAYEPGDADEGGALIGKITGGVPGMLLIIR